MSFGSKILKYREEMLRDLARLVAIPSVRSEAREGMPFGENSARALQTILAYRTTVRSEELTVVR